MAEALEPIYLLHGNENFLLEEFVKKLEGQFQGEIKRFDCSSESLQNIFNYAALNSLVGRQMLIVKNINACKDLGNKKVLAFVEKYEKNPNPNTVLVLCSAKALPASNMFLKIFAKAKICSFGKLNDKGVKNFIKENLVNITIDEEAIALLRLLTGDDLHVLSRELKQLSEGNFQKIDAAVISQQISFRRSYNPFEFLNAIIEKKSLLLEKFLQNNEVEAIPIVALLYSFFSKVMSLHANKNSEDFSQRYYLMAMRSFSLGKIRQIMESLLYADAQLKGINTTFVDEKNVLKNLIFEIVS